MYKMKDIPYTECKAKEYGKNLCEKRKGGRFNG